MSQQNETTGVSTVTEHAPKILKLYLKEPVEQQKQEEKKQAAPQRHVTWTEDTINNQGMGKMKSNLCCIYHRPGQGSSDTCTSDDNGNALERDRQTKKKHKQVCSKHKNKKSKDPCGKGHVH